MSNNAGGRAGPAQGDGSGSAHDDRSGTGGGHATTSIFSPGTMFGWTPGVHHDRMGGGDHAGSSSSVGHPNQASQGYLHQHSHVNSNQAQRGGNNSNTGAGGSNNHVGDSVAPYKTQRNNSNTGQNNVSVDQEASMDLLGVPDDDEDNDDDYEDTPNAGQGGYIAVASQGGNGVKRARTGNAMGSGPGTPGSPKRNKKGGGRPRDFVWVYFEDVVVDGKRTAHCKFCDYSVEQPKAFRMRQHILSCEEAPREHQLLVKEKEAAREIQAKEKKLTIAEREAAILNDGAASPGFQFIAPTTSKPSTSRAPRAGTVQPELDSRPPPQSAGLPFNFDYSAMPMMQNIRDASQDDDDDNIGNLSRRDPVLASLNSDVNPVGRKRKRNKVKEEINQSLAVLGMAQPKIGRSPITCHVLDSTAGRPGANIKLRMDQLSQTGFSHVASGETDSDGRNNSLLVPGTEIAKNSIFKLTFYTKDYWGSKGVESFYPFVEVVFEIKEPSEHHHIALMLSPFAYTTYRGS